MDLEVEFRRYGSKKYWGIMDYDTNAFYPFGSKDNAEWTCMYIIQDPKALEHFGGEEINNVLKVTTKEPIVIEQVTTINTITTISLEKGRKFKNLT